MSDVYILGSLNMDLAIESDRAPFEGETIAGKNFRTCPGGKGLNQAIAASKLGAHVKMLGAIGNDSFGKEMKEALIINKVDVTHIKTIDNVSSGIAIIQLINKDNRIILDLGANLNLAKKDVDSFLKTAKQDDIFLTQLENDVDIVGYALKTAKSKGMTTILNPAPANKKIVKYLQFVDIITPNETECDSLGEDKVLSANHVIKTLGKHGYKYISKDTEFSQEPIKVDVVDTTGAGDAFSGALAYILSIDKALNKKALDFASKAASISVTRKGTSVASPTLDEVINF